MNSIEQITFPFEKDSNRTATYEEAIAFYEQVAQQSPYFEIKQYGNTDSGNPLHIGILSIDKNFDPVSIRTKNKQILMVNNAIHPGEPCGVEASMMIIKKYLTDTDLQKYLKNTVVIFIPIYNIGGALNRNSTTRANQMGPASYGFRGNAKNLDLNRDFIKCDARNAQTFNQIYTEWQPDIFIDNHTSNGADYQYTITLIPTQHNRLDPNLAAFMNTTLLPRLYKDMEAGGWEMTPYVYARNTPDDGIAGFLDLARYSSGYASLFNAISFMPETHMLKPFKDRVQSTYLFMDCMIKAMHDEQSNLQAARQKAIQNTKDKSTFDLNWEMDMANQEKILFKGYEAKYKPSEVSGLDRLYYDRNAPYEKEIPFFNNYKATLSVEKPIAYIIPQAYSNVIERLKWNKVEMKQLNKDQEIEVELYRIGDFKDQDAYEGHYLHKNTQVEKMTKPWRYHKGDYIIYVDQATNRYIVETLEPQAPDSFFSWNFFDGILMQKEYFSAYVFEDVAAKYLQENADLKERFEKKKLEDEAFSKNAQAQLAFIYKNSEHYEYTHRIYPVGRLVKDVKLVH
jgi:zinc carboxypeptidase